MNSGEVAHRFARSAIGAVVGLHDERAIFFLFDRLNGACLKAVIVFLAFFLLYDIRHTASVGWRCAGAQ